MSTRFTTLPLRAATLRRLVALLVVALPLAGCAVLEPAPLEEDRRALARARALWQREGPARYRYVYAPYCDCLPNSARATWVTVDHGVVIEAAYVEDNEPVNAGPQVYGTVDSLFALVQRAYDQHAADVRVRYDAALGYPVEAWIDWRTDARDDESGFAVPAFSAMSETGLMRATVPAPSRPPLRR